MSLGSLDDSQLGSSTILEYFGILSLNAYTITNQFVCGLEWFHNHGPGIFDKIFSFHFILSCVVVQDVVVEYLALRCLDLQYE